ncbi:hypothetical protein M5K25_008562 [Dendrobium thyrsiflorum]|uniref:Protein kinase domain-containing protein n=1 Tax=Dendrobium thyrsiflorum TaxID=117978 RepID=A0ABD0V9L4_DENTH
MKEYRTAVTNNFLEIHLFWAGKGTSFVPSQGYYGPSICAISVSPVFIPSVSNKAPNSSSSSNKTGLIVGIIAGVVVLGLIIVAILVWRQKKKNVNKDEEELLGMAIKPNTFSYGELRAATEDFNQSNLLGEGGFGPVYKGKLYDGRMVAVKQLSVASHHGKRQFMAEIAIIYAVQQRNLVKLYGYCIEGDKRLLVYEYLQNKSLDKAIFGKNVLYLNWRMRFEICLGTARGLAYLHEESSVKIVHRDVKSSNILLDRNLNPKISDFGLSKLYDDKKTHISARVAGTIGYLAPEYAMRGHLTEKADVFGFGVVALEILSGRPNSDSTLEEEKVYLLDWAWRLYEQKHELDLVDPILPTYNRDEAIRVFGVALLCIQASPALRPPMSRVVAMLAGDVEVNEAQLYWGRQMDLQNTAFTVQLGRGAKIQLANAIVETGNAGATIQFGSVDFPTIAARTNSIPANGRNTEGFTRRLNVTEAPTRRVHLPAPRPTTEQPRRKVSVFERLSQSEAPTTRRVDSGGRISMMAANTTTLPTGLSAPGIYNAEASSSRGRLTRRQRRKKNAELRAQQQFLVHPSNLSAQEVEANVPTRNKFSDLKWVKRNSPTGELKQSFWDQRYEVPVPQKRREPETLSARVYRVLKTVKEKGLQKRRYQQPVMIEARRTPPREKLSFPTLERDKRRQRASHGELQGVTPEPRVQGSAAERSRWKGKKIRRPKPRRNEEENEERVVNLGVTSDMASRRSTPNSQEHQRRVQKKTHDDIHSDGRHLGESSRGSRRPATPPKEESNFDRSPRVEEVSLLDQEPEIQWHRRSEIRVLEVGENIAGREDNMEEEKVDLNEEGGYMDEKDYMEDEEDYLNEGGGIINEGVSDTLNMEVVYMVRHVEADYDDGEDDGDWQPLAREGRNRQRDISSIIGEGEHSPRE